MRSIYLLFLISFLGLINQRGFSQDTLIYTGDVWKYYDGDSIPEYAWITNNFPDDDWKEGKALLGYGQGDEATILSYGSDPEHKTITNYFRKTFYIDNPNEYFVYLLKLLRDDGAVVYLNGREIWRSNMPEGIITDSTRALTTVSGDEESIFYEFVISSNLFIEGKNCIAVSLHQSRQYTSDGSFDLELTRNNDLFSVNNLLRNQQGVEQILNRSFSLLSVQLELENKNNEINHLRLRNDNLRNYVIFAGALFFVILIVSFYLVIRNLKMSHEFGNKLQTTKNELLQKNNEIINYALSVVKHKQFLKQIKEELNVCKDESKLPKLERIISNISYYDDHEDEWERLKAHFDNVHSGFFGRLKDQYPSLTQAELQHCSYIKLQLPTKEIARMLNIDPKSVQASRYRIKKKMGLPMETDLREVIETF